MEDYFKQYPILRKYIICDYLPYKLYRILINTLAINPNFINEQFIQNIINIYKNESLRIFHAYYLMLLQETISNIDIKLSKPHLNVLYTSIFSPTYHQNGSDSEREVYMKYNSLCYIINYNNGNELKGTEIRFRNEDDKVKNIILPACPGLIYYIYDRYVLHRTPRILRSNINKNVIRILLRTFIITTNNSGTYTEAHKKVRIKSNANATNFL